MGCRSSKAASNTEQPTTQVKQPPAKTTRSRSKETLPLGDTAPETEHTHTNSQDVAASTAAVEEPEGDPQSSSPVRASSEQDDQRVTEDGESRNNFGSREDPGDFGFHGIKEGNYPETHTAEVAEEAHSNVDEGQRHSSNDAEDTGKQPEDDAVRENTTEFDESNECIDQSSGDSATAKKSETLREGDTDQNAGMETKSGGLAVTERPDGSRPTQQEELHAEEEGIQGTNERLDNDKTTSCAVSQHAPEPTVDHGNQKSEQSLEEHSNTVDKAETFHEKDTSVGKQEGGNRSEDQFDADVGAVVIEERDDVKDEHSETEEEAHKKFERTRKIFNKNAKSAAVLEANGRSNRRGSASWRERAKGYQYPEDSAEYGHERQIFYKSKRGGQPAGVETTSLNPKEARNTWEERTRHTAHRRSTSDKPIGSDRRGSAPKE
eukprot:gb/GECG01016329.1/.p1 GENE.gb/GECG01016329.1/~~gb/GECG01016329.1/.p1  ORF type:complete len:435 (+),score=95.00 gb/GECG01016329.1/:1-1305(+)